jgi:hypothetical protein
VGEGFEDGWTDGQTDEQIEPAEFEEAGEDGTEPEGKPMESGHDSTKLSAVGAATLEPQTQQNPEEPKKAWKDMIKGEKKERQQGQVSRKK